MSSKLELCDCFPNRHGEHVKADHIDGMYTRCCICAAPGHYVSAHPDQTCCYWCKETNHTTNEHKCSVCGGTQHRGRDHYDKRFI
jgi:hypothetical protein